jgi:hypothetical protein
VRNKEQVRRGGLVGAGGKKEGLPLDKLTNVSYYMDYILTFVSLPKEFL